MNIVLWMLQGLLALVFAAHGLLLLSPPAAIAEQLNAALPRACWVFLGSAEIAAAFGLTVPGLTRVAPWLVPSAAGGLIIVMVCATIWHLVRGELSSALTTVILLVLVTFVAYMRSRVLPIRPRAVA
jgi:hypothetical protein